jgi:uncharacterized protein YecE (DUF72 family)
VSYELLRLSRFAFDCKGRKTKTVSIHTKAVRMIPKGLHIGTSGWSYKKDWAGVFYRGSSSMLQQYLDYFDTSEINSTFYALPKPSFVKHLADSLGENVFFTAKLPRAVTHDNRLDLSGEGGKVLDDYFSLMAPLQKHLAVLLIQLPPWEPSRLADLESFLAKLDPKFRYAIEFRHESWLTEHIWKTLEDHRIGYVIVDEPKLPIDLRVTTDFAYVRWHGHGSRPWYNYRYSLDELEQWRPRLGELSDEAEAVVGYFNNHFSGNAPLNALQMLKLMNLANPRQEAKLERMSGRDEAVQASLDEY